MCTVYGTVCSSGLVLRDRHKERVSRPLTAQQHPRPRRWPSDITQMSRQPAPAQAQLPTAYKPKNKLDVPARALSLGGARPNRKEHRISSRAPHLIESRLPKDAGNLHQLSLLLHTKHFCVLTDRHTHTHTHAHTHTQNTSGLDTEALFSKTHQEEANLRPHRHNRANRQAAAKSDKTKRATSCTCRYIMHAHAAAARVHSSWYSAAEAT